MLDLRANTQVTVPIGPFVDKDDGLTPETGITLGAADEAEVLKHGSTTVVDISGATWAAITGMDGYFALTLTTSHVDTEGQLTVVVQDDSVCLPVRCSFRVLSEAAYDSLYAAKDDGYMDVNIKTIGRSDTQETEADNLESACSNYSATRGLAGTALPAAAADAAGGLPISDAGGLDLDNFVQDAIEANHLDHLFAAAYDASSKPGDSTAFLNRAVEHASGGNPRMTTVFVGNVQGQCNAALSAYDPPTRTEATADKNEILDTIGTPSDLGNGDDIATNLADIAGATFASSTDSLESLRDRGDAAWTTGAGGTPPQLLQSTTIATLASQTSFTLTAGSADDDAYNGAVVVVTDQSTSTQKAVGSVSDYTGSTKTVTLSSDPGIFTMAVGDSIDIIANASTAPSAAAVRAEIDANSTQLAAIVADTNELQGDWTDGGRLDLILDAVLTDTGTTLPASISGLNDLSTAEIDARLAAYDAPTKAELDAGFAALNDPTAAAIRAEIDANSTQLAAIVADTNELQSDWTDGGRLDLLVDAILVDTGTTLPASISALNDLSAAEVNAEVVDVITADNNAEPSSVPAANATLQDKIGWLYMLARNRMTQTATVNSVYADDGVTVVATSAVSDDGTTFETAEMS